MIVSGIVDMGARGIFVVPASEVKEGKIGKWPEQYRTSAINLLLSLDVVCIFQDLTFPLYSTATFRPILHLTFKLRFRSAT
jgi:hypothetical protein